MRKVKLITKTGGHVTTVVIPQFLPGSEPDFLVWGARFFMRCEDPDIYEEGFGIAAVASADITEVGGEVIGVVQPAEEGNDDLLSTQPKTLEDAVEDCLSFYSTAPDFKVQLAKPEKDFIAITHHFSGQFMRNSLFLWWYSGHGYKEWPKSKPPLVAVFNDLGITHADDMSSILLTTAYRKWNSLPILLHEQVAKYKLHWKKNGFPDGIFVPSR